jgi:DNA-binding NarL/FixJ family response regulator
MRVVDRLAPTRAIVGLESKGLVQMEMTRGRPELRLAHPLYGEVLHQRSRTRTRSVKRWLVRAMEGVGVRRNEDIIRLATWRLDAGEPVSGTLLTSAAQRAESLFAHELAERFARAATESGEGFEARLVLGQSLAGQSRYLEAEELLAGLVERAITDNELARAALARGSNLMFGLVRPAEAVVALENAEKATMDPNWRDELAALRAYCLVWSARGEDGLELAHQTLNRSTDIGRARLQALIAVAAGSLNRARFADVLEASEQGLPIARRLADDMPMAEAQLHGASWWALLGTGRITEAARLAEEQFTLAIDSSLYDAAAYLAVPYAYSALVQGRAKTATRRFLEVMPLLREHDVLGDQRLAASMLSQAAAIAGDLPTAEAALAEAESPSRPTARAILAEVFLRLGRAWVATAKADIATAGRMAVEAAEMARNLGAVALEAVVLHHAVRLGDASDVVSRLKQLAAQVPGSIADPFARHAAAVLARDGAALDSLSATFEAMGSPLLAAEAAVDASSAHSAAGYGQRAGASRHRATALAAQCEDASTPALALLAAEEPDPLTRREREVAILAARGLTSKQIADRLGVTVRTVDNHLSHVFGKLGLTSRQQLRTLAIHRPATC